MLSCKEKEKTYETLEAEVLCDVLPELIKDELNESLLRAKRLPLIPPPDLDSIKYSRRQLDSIVNHFEQLNKKYVQLFENKIDSSIIVLNQFKKYEILLIDTLRYVKKLKTDRNIYIFDSLGLRGLRNNDFSKCNLDVKIVSLSETFEGEDRETHKTVFFPTRVLISKDKQYSFFSILKMYGGYHVFCKYSKKLKKWKIAKIIKE